MSWNELLFDFVTLWVTVDPLGTVPLYLSVTKHLPAPVRRRAAIQAQSRWPAPKAWVWIKIKLSGV